MGYRSKLLVAHTAIKLPKEFAEQHKKGYYISQLANGSHVMNISSKHETKGHWSILLDLEEIMKKETSEVYAVVLWEDGKVDRHNLKTGEHEVFLPKDD
tara:strand:- start:4585 stop:4881 length:297 start_codon:yes stop_codon:yes gene_type:complete